jgi:methionine synthase II (cobalamin-independent)
MAANNPTHKHVHLVGSLPLPDGETGARGRFVWWQRSIVGPADVMLKPMEYSYGVTSKRQPPPISPSEAKKIVAGLGPIETGYDSQALESYALLKEMRAQGVIRQGVKFQVSIPTPFNPVALHLKGEFKPFMELVYMDAILRAVRRIQDEIPHEDLAIQFDCAAEFMLLEGVNLETVVPWFPATVEEVSGRIVKLVEAVDKDVDAGIHLCYGDSRHKHFTEPVDMGLMVDVALAVIKGAKRQLNWVHMPVPKSRTDEAYFEPLKRLALKLGATTLFLGLVHAGDEKGTRERVKTAEKFVHDFGVATECGMGRTPPADLDSILEISARVCEG